MDHPYDILLEDDHARLDAMLQLVFEAVEIRDPLATFENLDHFWALLAVHIRAEHLHLFPVILRKAGEPGLAGSLAGLADRLPDQISELRRDHDFFIKEIGKDVNRLRHGGQKADNFELGEIQENLFVVRQRLNGHNELEENDIYPLTAILLTAEEMADLRVSINRELDNIPPRFKDEPKKGK